MELTSEQIRMIQRIHQFGRARLWNTTKEQWVEYCKVEIVNDHAWLCRADNPSNRHEINELSNDRPPSLLMKLIYIDNGGQPRKDRDRIDELHEFLSDNRDELDRMYLPEKEGTDVQVEEE